MRSLEEELEEIAKGAPVPREDFIFPLPVKQKEKEPDREVEAANPVEASLSSDPSPPIKEEEPVVVPSTVVQVESSPEPEPALPLPSVEILVTEVLEEKPLLGGHDNGANYKEEVSPPQRASLSEIVLHAAEDSVFFCKHFFPKTFRQET